MRRLSIQGERTAAVAVALLAALAAALVQVTGRGPLEWDESIRVEAGWHLAYLLRQGDLAGAWQWVNDQTFYPFLMPTAHGLLMLAGASPLVSAWLPGVAAFGLAIYLVWAVAGSAGAGPTGRWLAVAFFLCVPLEVRLSATGLTELPGLCVYLGLLLALARMLAAPRLRTGILAGALVAVGSWMKWDYGAIAAATLLAAGVVAALQRRHVADVRPHFVAVAVAGLLAGGLLAVNLDAKLRGMTYFTPSVYPGQRDPFYLVAEIWSQDDLWPLFAALLLAGVVAGAALWRSRPAMRPALLFVLISYAAYTVENNRGHQRYLAPALAVLAVLSAVGVDGALPEVRRWLGARLPAGFAPGVVATALVVLLAPQLPALAGRLNFTAPDPTAGTVAAFGVDHIAPVGATAYIGASDEISPYALMVTWEARNGSPSPPVLYVPESPPGSRWGSLVDFLESRAPASIIAVGIPPGSRLDTADHRAVWPGQYEYFVDAQILGLRGCLHNDDQVFTDGGQTEVIAWSIPAGSNISTCAGGPP